MGNGFQSARTGMPVPPRAAWYAPPRRAVVLPLVLFLLTIVSTLSVGAHFARTFRRGVAPFAEDLSLAGTWEQLVRDPLHLLTGWPFALTLMAILGVHELGHFFAARRHRIHATYPYFIPFPNLIGTMGAFIRIQSPIVDRRALFDVGVAGPLAGFIVAVPALIVGILNARVLPAGADAGVVVFGNPPLVWALTELLQPGVPDGRLLLHPMGQAAWVGLFATALNLLPVGQLDGGHILYAVNARRHRLLSQISLFALLAVGAFGFLYPQTVWPGWTFWGGILLMLGMRHPAVLNPGRGLDRGRLRVAVASLGVFLLCFTPLPFYVP